jgi:hypothetical protein
MKELRRSYDFGSRPCPICGKMMMNDKRTFSTLVCVCGHKEKGRMNSVVDPRLEKRGVVDVWKDVIRF